MRRRRRNRTIARIRWYTDAARLRARADDAPLALRYTVAGARHDHPPGVSLESMRELPRPLRLWLRRLERVRDTAGESLSERVAR